jgi:hypothetical protein
MFFGVTRPFRRQLALIRYYSARRHFSRWQRWADRALVAALLLAVPATIMSGEWIITRDNMTTVSGVLVRTQGAAPWAVLHSERRGDGALAGGFDVITGTESGGWPLATWSRRRVLQVDLNLFDEEGVRVDARLSWDDPIAISLASALERHDGTTAWRYPDVGPWRGASGGAWLLQIGIWWVGLMVVFLTAVGAARMGWAVVFVSQRTRRTQRTRRGHCPSCGYDTVGLEFSPRCPECGALLE